MENNANSSPDAFAAGAAFKIAARLAVVGQRELRRAENQNPVSSQSEETGVGMHGDKPPVFTDKPRLSWLAAIASQRTAPTSHRGKL